MPGSDLDVLVEQLWGRRGPDWPVRVAWDASAARGHREVERYAVVPRRGSARFRVPLSTRAAASASLLRYNALRPVRKRLARSAMGAAFATGTAAPLRRDVLRVLVDDRVPAHDLASYLVSHHLRQALDVPDLALGIGVHPPTPNAKPTLQVFDPAGRPLAYAKVGRGSARALVEREVSQGEGLTDFALHCALAQRHGPNWQQWPEQVRDPRGPAARAAAEELSEQLEFWCWVQLLCDEQLAAAAAAAAEVGMPIGVVHDLAVGVDPHGADAWALQDVLAIGATVGAPPDLLNQLGQNWGLPPWHPRQLAETGYAPFRDMVRSVLRHSGGIRIDHVMGLFRLWWVPTGSTADRGSYVSYDAQAMLAVLLLEAHRAGAVVVGEDLGTVEPAVTKAMAGAEILGSAVAWFENDPDDERRPLPPARWRELAMASVTTHDLPTVAGWYTGDSVRLRAELGQLSRSAEEEQRERADERAALLDALRAEGLLAAGGTGVAAGTPSGVAPPVEDVSLALHRLLVRTPSRLVLAAFGDAVGDLRQPNLPGTLDEYPNWRLPVADAEGRPLTLEQLREHPGVRRLIEVLRQV